jgi:predicted lipoprotein
MKYFLLLIIFSYSIAVNASGEAFYNQVIQGNVNNALVVSEQLLKSITSGNKRAIKNDFKQLIFTWKKVEATYILGDLNEDYLDTPRYLDIFHGNNEHISQQLDLIITSNDALSIALYKHSHKSINALEYILFTQNLNNSRVSQIATLIATSIHNYLSEIKQGYKQQKETFINDKEAANAYLLNTLVSGTYKLKEWRIGDVAGLSKKYKQPKLSRAEYFLSNNSITAINAILSAQQQVINSPGFEDFGDIARKFNANAEIEQAIAALVLAIHSAKTMTDNDLTKPKGKALYLSTNNLMQAYYIALMDKLGFVSKVLDADGD